MQVYHNDLLTSQQTVNIVCISRYHFNSQTKKVEKTFPINVEQEHDLRRPQAPAGTQSNLPDRRSSSSLRGHAEVVAKMVVLSRRDACNTVRPSSRRCSKFTSANTSPKYSYRHQVLIARYKKSKNIPPKGNQFP